MKKTIVVAEIPRGSLGILADHIASDAVRSMALPGQDRSWHNIIRETVIAALQDDLSTVDIEKFQESVVEES